LSETPSLAEERRKQTEVKRRIKWVKMIKKWDSFEGSEKVRFTATPTLQIVRG